MTMIKQLLLLPLALLLCLNLQAQSVDELKSMKTAKEDQIKALQAEVADLENKIFTMPGWKFGGVGTLGFNMNANNNWFAIATPNSSGNGLGIGITAFANQDQEKYFWRNGLNVNLNRLATLVDKDNDGTKAVTLSDLLDFTSLFGYKLTDKIALSAEAKWLSSIVNFDPNDVNDVLDDEYSLSFNNPGQLTVSAGVTWTPITDLVVVIHPLGYQKNWPGEFISSAGAKIGATYTKELFPGVKWNSSLNAFIPYSSGDSVDHKNNDDSLLRTVDYDGGQLTNWTWNNGFSFTVWKGIGVGLNLGLRGDKQVADLGRLKSATDPATLDISDNPLQSFWNLGLSYGF